MPLQTKPLRPCRIRRYICIWIRTHSNVCYFSHILQSETILTKRSQAIGQITNTRRCLVGWLVLWSTHVLLNWTMIHLCFKLTSDTRCTKHNRPDIYLCECARGRISWRRMRFISTYARECNETHIHTCWWTHNVVHIGAWYVRSDTLPLMVQPYNMLWMEEGWRNAHSWMFCWRCWHRFAF